ncbi:MAG: phosphonate ABC transporter, permease protein PhnE [Turicibacter sp.]|nr:phosphonate ABC transporter, permease protein PhnE [Turicibacter sp.]
MKRPNIDTLFLTIVVLYLIISSFLSIDLGSAQLSSHTALNAFAGLFRPDWGFVNDGSREDLLSLLLLTLGIAFLGTLIATLISLPLSILSARNIVPSYGIVPRIGKFVSNILRTFPELIYAILFVTVVGPGPFAGILAIGVNQIGMLGKLYTDEWESIDHAPVEAMEAVGANFWQVLFYARIPQIGAKFLSLSLNHFEIALRSATVLGLVGAGGLGAPIIFAIQSRNWSRVGIILLGIILTISIVDYVTGLLRKRLM